jgi:hypothetical protein
VDFFDMDQENLNPTPFNIIDDDPVLGTDKFNSLLTNTLRRRMILSVHQRGYIDVFCMGVKHQHPSLIFCCLDYVYKTWRENIGN